MEIWIIGQHSQLRPYKSRLTKIGVAAGHLRMIMSSGTRKASWLELFYDLIFVVAIAKATHVLGHPHQGHIAAELYLKYVLIMIPLWWAWSGYTLFVNLYGGDDTLQRLMALSQMACAIALSMSIDPNFDPNYRGFLLSYVAFRSLLVLMHWRAASLTTQRDQSGRYLAKGFAIGALISLSSLAFGGIWKYVVLYLGIAFDMGVPLYGRRRLKTIPAESHHLPERYGSLTIILLGESIANLTITFEQASWSGMVIAAGIAGFVLTVAIWWTYFENLEAHIYGRRVGTGQIIIYVHLFIYIGLGGIANSIRFAIAPALALADYKLLVGMSAICFMLAMQWLHLIYRPKEARLVLLGEATIFYSLLALVLVFALTAPLTLLGLSDIFIVYAVSDDLGRGHSEPERTSESESS